MSKTNVKVVVDESKTKKSREKIAPTTSAGPKIPRKPSTSGNNPKILSLVNNKVGAKVVPGKSYVAIQPSPNKIIARKWDEKNRQNHLSRLATIKPGIDNSPPKTYTHLVNRPKKVQIEQGKYHQSLIPKIREYDFNGL